MADKISPDGEYSTDGSSSRSKRSRPGGRDHREDHSDIPPPLENGNQGPGHGNGTIESTHDPVPYTASVDPDPDDGTNDSDGTDDDDTEDTDEYVKNSLDLRDSRHDSLIGFHEGRVETTFGTTDKEYRKTYDAVFDHSTLTAIYHLFQRKALGTLEYPISTGKEANVFLGTDAGGGPVAVKIFRENTATFRRVRPYIEGDPRFKNIPQNKRQLIPIWAKKEYKNLKRLEHAGVRAPVAAALHRNILIMEYLGDESVPAPTLRTWWLENRETVGAPERLKTIFSELLVQMRLMHREAELVHSDLSEFNILIHGDLPYIIDVGQAVVMEHPMSGEFLARDLRNIAAYFRKQGIRTDEETLTTFINADE